MLIKQAESKLENTRKKRNIIIQVPDKKEMRTFFALSDTRKNAWDICFPWTIQPDFLWGPNSL